MQGRSFWCYSIAGLWGAIEGVGVNLGLAAGGAVAFGGCVIWLHRTRTAA